MIPLFDYDRYRLIMESSFSFQGYDFLYFDTPVDFYSLFRTGRKINTFQELIYIAEVLIYLNPNISEELFYRLMLQLADRTNGHVIRTYSEKRIMNMCSIVLQDKKVPYCRRKRKIVFNPAKMMSLDDKRFIIGNVISTKVNEEVIYYALEELFELDEKITLSSIAEVLKCSRQTVSKKMTKSLKEIIDYHNNNLKTRKQTDELLDIINQLTNNGKDKLKIKSLKKLTSIRDYSLIKNTISDYFDN